jgi:hypothetical protein
MKNVYLFFAVLFTFLSATAQDLVLVQKIPGSMVLADQSGAASIYVDFSDDSLVQKSARFLQTDIEMVSGKKPLILEDLARAKNQLVIIGSIGGSSLIKKLMGQKKLNLDAIRGKWEAYQIQVVENPVPGISRALVIAGSDRRGVAYGVFELSSQIGVSPWYWWADVPVRKKNQLYISANKKITDAPTVRYRGIFINDEAPALSNWSKEKFGGFNHLFYEKVFELLLRLKGNYLWPAMWGNAFYDDDPLNKKTADEYGIVIGTSHHEPLLRAHDEWRRYGSGKWNYDSNEVRLKEFWKEGMRRAANTETIVSVGMRGDGDEPMTQGTATALLERIVKDQRTIISDVTGKDPSATPQLWALYKEVQDYYDKGMRVPDDITLLLCDDNWGNIRKLPRPGDPPRSGGYGIYYHFDYVGGPRNYKWINTNNLARVWEQMHLAYKHGVDRIWIVNVGDIKPMELPISFFLDYAWKPSRWQAEKIPQYYTQWAQQQFGKENAVAIGRILEHYSRYSARRKPELVSHQTYSLENYGEADRVMVEYRQMLQEAEKIQASIPGPARDAYFQLVLHPVKAFTILHEMYTSVARNRMYAARKHIQSREWAEKAKTWYVQDSLLTREYHSLRQGKWNHMMSQTHIGYTYWQQPPMNKMPDLVTVPEDSVLIPLALPVKKAEAGVHKKLSTALPGKNVFYEKDGYVSIEAEHFSKAQAPGKMKWTGIPGIGRTSSGISLFPPTTTRQKPGGQSPHLAYEFYTADTGNCTIQCYFSPTLDFYNQGGLRYAISIDEEPPVEVNLHENEKQRGVWDGWVANNIIIKRSQHRISKPGSHVIKYWMVDPGPVLQKLVIDFGGVKPSYLGPPETKINQ